MILTLRLLILSAAFACVQLSASCQQSKETSFGPLQVRTFPIPVKDPTLYVRGSDSPNHALLVGRHGDELSLDILRVSKRGVSSAGSLGVSAKWKIQQLIVESAIFAHDTHSKSPSGESYDLLEIDLKLGRLIKDKSYELKKLEGRSNVQRKLVLTKDRLVELRLEGSRVYADVYEKEGNTSVDLGGSFIVLAAAYEDRELTWAGIKADKSITLFDPEKLKMESTARFSKVPDNVMAQLMVSPPEQAALANGVLIMKIKEEYLLCDFSGGITTLKSESPFDRPEMKALAAKRLPPQHLAEEEAKALAKIGRSLPAEIHSNVSVPLPVDDDSVALIDPLYERATVIWAGN